MNPVTPAQIVKTFQSKKGNEVVIRYPSIEDGEEMTRYINELSAEDTFITFSGEQLSLEEEKKYLENMLLETEKGDALHLACFVGKKLVAIANVDRNKTNRKRSLHVGIFGISVAKEYRHEGIGYELMKTILNEAVKMKDIKMIELHVYGNNQVAYELYKTLGFKEGGRIPGYYFFHGEYVDGIHMFKEV